VRVHVSTVRIANTLVREIHLVHPAAAKRNRFEVAPVVLLDQSYLFNALLAQLVQLRALGWSRATQMVAESRLNEPHVLEEALEAETKQEAPHPALDLRRTVMEHLLPELDSKRMAAPIPLDTPRRTVYFLQPDSDMHTHRDASGDRLDFLGSHVAFVQ
jgi:hypothetical protein